MMKVFIKIVLAVAVILVVACSTRPRVPRSMPGEKEMAAVLADIYQVESVLDQTRLSYDSRKEDRFSGYYRFVLEQHNLTKAEFDTAMGWYSEHPTVLSDVYEDVVEILSRREAELKNKMNKEKEERDLVKMPNKQELWNDTTAFTIPLDPKDSLDNRLPFNIETDSLDRGIIRLFANYQFKEGSVLDSAQMQLIACYADSTIETESSQIQKSFKEVSGNLSHVLKNGKQLVKLKGFLFLHDTAKVSTVEVSNVKLTYLPKIDPEDIKLR